VNTNNKPANTSVFPRKKALLLPLVALVGIVVAIMLVRSKPSMVHDAQAKALQTAVSYITLSSQKLRPVLSGYGVVEPDIELNVASEISGMVSYVHPELRKGAMMSAGTEVVRIDERDYVLASRQAVAELAIARANLKELDRNTGETRTSLKLVQQKLKLAETELARLAMLQKKALTSRSNVDNQNSQVIQLRQEAQNLNTQLEITPPKRQVLIAKIDTAKANVELRQRDLQRTRVTIPFDARIDTNQIEAGQFVARGARLFTLQNMDKVTVNAQFPIDQFRKLANSFNINAQQLRSALTLADPQQFFRQMGIRARVELPDLPGIIWSASVERLNNSLDTSARTVGVIVSVNHPYQKIQPGVRPPLLKGMYVKITLEGAPGNYLSVPRSALEGDRLYRVDADNRLQILHQSPTHLSGEWALFATTSTDHKAALRPGDKIITSALFPAAAGMLLLPTLDQTVRSVTGEQQ